MTYTVWSESRLKQTFSIYSEASMFAYETHRRNGGRVEICDETGKVLVTYGMSIEKEEPVKLIVVGQTQCGEKIVLRQFGEEFTDHHVFAFAEAIANEGDFARVQVTRGHAIVREYDKPKPKPSMSGNELSLKARVDALITAVASQGLCSINQAVMAINDVIPIPAKRDTTAERKLSLAANDAVYAYRRLNISQFQGSVALLKAAYDAWVKEFADE